MSRSTAQNEQEGKQMGNYTDALIEVKGLIDAHYPYPTYQDVTDITEHIEFARLAEKHKLSSRQYEMLIMIAESYYAKLKPSEA